ncbi:unnamed protein product [Lymnaea stagnalis]|uniref:Uncharacterized protein n=1 Tax=Lymnaea stagnalis TaxID=6523 RepID=A0AAV2IKI8_LYMST
MDACSAAYRLYCTNSAEETDAKHKLNNGNHEVECFNDKSDTGTRKLETCKKNPGHVNFIPVTSFQLGNLPVQCRDKRLVSYIRFLSRLVVHLSARFTSVNRPEHYPCFNSRGTSGLRNATGFTWIPGEIEEIPCPIKECPYSQKEHTVYGYLRVMTNKHVVYDLGEALNTVGRLYFDSTDQYSSIQCVGLDYSTEDSDVAHLRCVTHDAALLPLVKGQQEKAYRTYKSIAPETWRKCQGLCVVISHPHGLAKAITVGAHVMFEVTRNNSRAHYYNAATCPGSSGAPVLYVCQREEGAHPMWVPAVHSYHCRVTNFNCAFK